MGWNDHTSFNPMMQMQMQMPNGMQGGNWNDYSGMMGTYLFPPCQHEDLLIHVLSGMDPMIMSQGMFGNFGGQGMDMSGMTGMNGMNMGMGYGNGYGSGWSGQQMINGDYSGTNAGYYPGSGYNQTHQGHYPHHQMHASQQQFSKNMSQSQNRFQGGHHQQRGGLARGFHGQANYGSDPSQALNQVPGQDQDTSRPSDIAGESQKSEDEPFAHQLPVHLHGGSGPQQPPEGTSKDSKADSIGLDQDQIDDQKVTEKAPLSSKTTTEHDPVKQGENISVDNLGESLRDNGDQPGPPVNQGNAEAAVPAKNDSLDPSNGEHANNGTTKIDTFESDMQDYMNPSETSYSTYMSNSDPYQQNQMQQYGMAQDGFGRGRFYNRGMNRGGMGFQGSNRGRGGYNSAYTHNSSFGFGGGQSSIGGDVTVLAGGETKGPGVEGAPTGPKAMREGLPNTGFSSRRAMQAAPKASTVSQVDLDVHEQKNSKK